MIVTCAEINLNAGRLNFDCHAGRYKLAVRWYIVIHFVIDEYADAMQESVHELDRQSQAPRRPRHVRCAGPRPPLEALWRFRERIVAVGKGGRILGERPAPGIPELVVVLRLPAAATDIKPLAAYRKIRFR